MVKRFKLRISRVIPSFQSCRSKDPSSLPVNPSPAFFRLSPVNPKSFDIDFPATTASRNPPPLSKPRHSSFRRHVSSATAIVSAGCGCRPRPGGHVSPNRKGESSEYKWKKEEKWHVVARVQDDTPRRKIYNSSDSSDTLGYVSPPPPPTTEKKKAKTQRIKKNKSKPRARISTSSADSGWFSSEGGEENDEETETLVSSSRSFTTDSSSEFNPQLETIRESPNNGLRRKKKNPKRTKRGKRYTCTSSGGESGTGKTKTYPSPETGSPARLSMFQRLIPCTVDGKVKESFAVVKRSEDPYEDFKRSMLEMILEKQMFEAKDLEQLLHCFLSLNSRHHHGIIVQAFTDIWEVLFCKSPRTQLV